MTHDHGAITVRSLGPVLVLLLIAYEIEMGIVFCMMCTAPFVYGMSKLRETQVQVIGRG